jgi:hypothetical protein
MHTISSNFFLNNDKNNKYIHHMPLLQLHENSNAWPCIKFYDTIHVIHTLCKDMLNVSVTQDMSKKSGSFLQ